MIELIAGNCLTFLLSGLISFLFGVVFIMMLMGIGLRYSASVIGGICFYGGLICMAACSLAWGMFLISLVAKFIVIVRG